MSTTARQEKRQRQREARKRKKKVGSLLGGARVLIQRPATDAPVADGGTRAWRERHWASEGRAIHPVVRLAEDGADWGVPPESGDLIGYGMHPYRTDDCLQAAIATATQVPVEQVPDFRLDQRLKRGEDPAEVSASTWSRVESWAAAQELTLTFWDDEVPNDRERWVGVICSATSTEAYEMDKNGRLVLQGVAASFNDHCLVMTEGSVLFNPACSVQPPPGMKYPQFTADEITYGFSFEKEE